MLHIEAVRSDGGQGRKGMRRDLMAAAALLAATAATATATAIAQQAQPAAANAQPPVGLGVGIEPSAEGPRIAAVAPGGTGAAVGIRAGDILLRLGGRQVDGPQVLNEYVQSLKVGDPVTVLVRRDGREVELKGAAKARPQGTGGGGGPPPNRSTPVEAGELRETWNDRVSAGPPVGVFGEAEGWSMGHSMPLGRSEHAVAEMNGQGLGARRLSARQAPFQPRAGLRSGDGPLVARPALPQPIHHMMVTSVGGMLYLIGGEIDGASTGRPAVYVADTWVHDPAAGGWVKRAPMPDRAERRRQGGGGRQDLRCRRPPARGLGLRGLRSGDRQVGKASRPADPAQPSGDGRDRGKIIVAGGRVDDVDSERLTTVEIYDPKTRRWTKGAPLPAPRGGITGAALGGCMFVFGGEGERSHVLGMTPNTYGYDPRADRWTRLADLPIGVHGLKGSAVIDGRIFLPGGAVTWGGNTGTNAVQVYRPQMRCE
jgi:hypothetical protein